MPKLIRVAILAAPLFCLLACDGGTADDGGDDNQAPTANAGDDVTVEWGRTVLLEGACDDADADDVALLTYAWSLEAGATGSALTTASLNNADTAEIYFDPDEPGDYTVGLTCNDTKVSGAIDLVVVTVGDRPPNESPVVDAGEDTVVSLGDELLLFASANDPDGDPLTFVWTLETAAAGSTMTSADIVNADAAQASIEPDVVGDFIFQIAVSDGKGGSASDTVTITVNVVEPLDGVLEVTVLDRHSLAPISGATVAVGSVVVTGNTDASGQLTHTEAGLTGPVDVTVRVPGTVEWDHDGDPITAAVTTPEYRMTTMTGVDRPAVNILVERTGATLGGDVIGVVPDTLFNRLPDHTLNFPSIDLIGASTFSGQVRLVLVMPVLPVGGGAEIEINDLLANSPGGDVPFPGNLTTDDAFFNAFGTSLGRELGPNGEPSFTVFGLHLPAGTQRLAVVGGLGTLDLEQLIPLFLSGLGEGAIGKDLGIVLSAIGLQTLFAGVIEVEVPAGGQVDISTVLADEAVWNSSFEMVGFSSLVEAATIDDPLDPGIEYELQQLRVFPDHSVTVAAAPPGADPRVAANLPANVPLEIFCGSGMATAPCEPAPNVVNVPVPASTHTDVPFAMNVLLLTVPPGHALAAEGGAVPIGFSFTKTPRDVWPATEFGVPALDGVFAGLSFEAVSFAFRRISVRESDGTFIEKPGKVTDAAAGLGIDSTVSLDAGRSLPQITESGGGIEVTVLVDLDDLTVDPTETPSNIVNAQAMVVGLGVPDIATELPSTFTVSSFDSVGLQVMSVRTVDRNIEGGAITPVATPVWDVFFPGQATNLVVPTVPAALGSPWPGSASELEVILAGYRFRGSFTYQDATPTTLARRRVGLQADTWSFDKP